MARLARVRGERESLPVERGHPSVQSFNVPPEISTSRTMRASCAARVRGLLPADVSTRWVVSRTGSAVASADDIGGFAMAPRLSGKASVAEIAADVGEAGPMLS